MKKQVIVFLLGIALITSCAAQSVQSPLIKASSKGDALAVQKLIDLGVNINEPDSEGYTPLMYAVWSGKADTVKVLLNKGADVNAKDKSGNTPFFYASNSSYFDIVALLIDKGADVKAGDNELLLNAASSICSERNPSHALNVVRLLIKSGADINAKSPEGETVLDLVLCSMDIYTIHDLIKAGANLWTPEEGKARIFFVGTELVLGNSTIWVGKKYKTLNINTNQGLAFYDVKPGKHTHYSTPFRSTIEVKAGQTYYFKVTQKRNVAAEVIGLLIFTPATLLKTTIDVTSFPEVEAKQAIKKMLKLEELK